MSKKHKLVTGSSLKRPPLKAANTQDKTDNLKPWFSFEFLDKEFGMDECGQRELASLSRTIDKLSKMTWFEIRNAPRHGLGTEKIATDTICRPVPPDVNLLAIRFFKNAPMVGYREGRIFHIIFLDKKFKLYDHG